MGEEKKPSSLRTRIDRTRQSYERKGNPMPLIIGAGFMLVVGIVLYTVVFSTPPNPAKVPNQAPPQLLQPPANPNLGPASGRPAMPKTDETAAYEFTEEAKTLGKTDPTKALEMLKGSLGKWPKYDAELYCAMGKVVGERETQLQGEALRQMWAEKAEYYQKALELIDAGGKFAYGKHEVRIANLKTVINVAKEKAGM